MTSTVFAPAKINLWLDVFPPDATGYHPLDTLFCAIDLADEIVIAIEHSGIDVMVTGADVGPAERNLAYRAAAEFFQAIQTTPRATIHFTKRIPAGGGLGGGSSDAASVLAALNALHESVVPPADLMAIAARLGSDVPFFLCGSPLAHATGRGEVLRGVPALPVAPLVLVVPPFGVATVDAYQALDAARAFSVPEHTRELPRSWDDVARTARNDFERSSLRAIPSSPQCGTRCGKAERTSRC